jgi:hypothetical protein
MLSAWLCSRAQGNAQRHVRVVNLALSHGSFVHDWLALWLGAGREFSFPVVPIGALYCGVYRFVLCGNYLARARQWFPVPGQYCWLAIPLFQLDSTRKLEIHRSRSK